MASLSDECDVCKYHLWADLSVPFYQHFSIPRTHNLGHGLQGPHISSLNETSEAGCLGCSLLIAAFGAALKDNPKMTLLIVKRPEGHSLITLTSIQWGNGTDWHSSQQTKEQDFEVYTSPGTTSVPGIPVRIHLQRDTYPEHSLPLISGWLSTCSQKHVLCAKNAQYVPPRLLDLSHNAQSADIRLIEARQQMGIDGPKIEYACLSHCWGDGAHPLSTTKRNLAMLRAGITLPSLPQTFKDAVEICRALDIHYLWIDSLCIVQDDDFDWEIHVAEMTEVYANSHLTLAAADSSNGEGGLFRRVSSQEGSDLPLAVRCAGSYTAFQIRKIPRHWFEADRSVKCNGPAWPLMRRAWVFQEFLLSPRVVAFAKEEVVWACLGSSECCCGSPASDLSLVSNTGFGLKRQLAQLRHMQSDQVAELWRNIINTYSELRLTYSKDRLPAITGVAKLFKEVHGDEFLGGIWLRDLARSLYWERAGGGPMLPRGSAGIRQGPSWVWSARDFEVNFPPVLDLASAPDVVSILGYDVTRSRENEFSALISGQVTVQGILLPLSLNVLETTGSQGDELSIRELWRHDCAPANQTHGQLSCFTSDFALGHSLADINKRLSSVRLLLVSCGVLKYDAENLSIEGILVEETQTESDSPSLDRPVFERIGALSYSNFEEASLDPVEKWGGLKLGFSTFDLV